MNLVAVIAPSLIFSVTVGFIGVTQIYGWILAFLFVIVFFYLFLFQGLGKIKDKKCSYECGKAKEGEGAPRRRTGVKELLRAPAGMEDVKTCYDIFQNGVKLAGDKDCMGVREGAGYKWYSYKQVNEKIHNVASAFIEVGLEPGNRVGFYAKNRMEWAVGAEACNAVSLTSVAIYDTLGVENREFVVNQSQIRAIFTTKNLLKNLIDLENSELLDHIIIMDGENLTDQDRSDAEAANFKIYTYEEFEKIGAENKHEPIKPRPEDLAILMYTSGTTSRPKGVMITHANMVAVLAGVLFELDINTTDTYLSYLPLAHILERGAEAAHFITGARVGFYQGDIRKLNDDISACKPTIYAGVPKVYQRVMNTIKQKIGGASPVVQLIFNISYSLKKRLMECGLPYGFLDKIVFNKVKEGLGGQCRCIISGGAPLSAECHEFIKVCFSCPVIQGYGLTETCGGATITPLDYVDPFEKAGAPICSAEVKLVDFNKYTSKDNPPRGEVCVRGINVTNGYYEMEEKTKEEFVEEEDGKIWFHTGDLGRWNPDGTLSIIGRRKDIFKLDTGEYVAPERLETKYSSCQYVANIFVYGESTKSHLVAIIVPEVTRALEWAESNNVDVPDKKETQGMDCPVSICNNKDFQKLILDDLKRVAIESKLQRYEQLPKIRLDTTFWTPETNLVTSALKNKRPVLYDYYEKQIKEMYA